MKLPAFEAAPGSAWRSLFAGVALGALVGLSTVTLAAGDPSPSPSASPEASANPAKAGKNKQSKSSAPVSRDIPIVLPIGEKAEVVKIPQLDGLGRIISQLMTARMTRLDVDHLQMQGSTLDLNKADGKSDYHIEIPTSVFNTTTRIITSEEPVVIRTEDFELTGEKMKFDLAERSGELLGKVKMRIHNLKSAAGFVPQQIPETE